MTQSTRQTHPGLVSQKPLANRKRHRHTFGRQGARATLGPPFHLHMPIPTLRAHRAQLRQLSRLRRMTKPGTFPGLVPTELE